MPWVIWRGGSTPGSSWKESSGHMLKIPKNSSLLDTLEQRGFLSAERMLEQVIHMRKSKFGSQRIVHELREKGIAENLIAAALPDIKETEQDSACEVWRKKFGAIPADAKELARQMRFLMGRGFTAEVMRQVLRHADKEEA